MSNLYMERQGVGQPLVLVHGWGMNAAVWGDFADKLAAQFEVIRLELPGHGRSPWQQGYRFQTLDQWADSCLEQVPGRAIWVGWSLGAMVAIQAALRLPERVSRLLLLSGTPKYAQSGDWPNAIPEEVLSQFASALSTDQQETLKQFLALQVRGADGATQTLRRLRSAMSEIPTTIKGALEVGLRLLQETDLRQGLSHIKCPIHWILGQRDTLVPEGVAEQLLSLRPDMEVIRIKGAGHAPFLSHTDEVVDQMLQAIGSAEVAA